MQYPEYRFQSHHQILKICRAIVKQAADNNRVLFYTDHIELAFGLLLDIDDHRFQYHALIWGAIRELIVAWCSRTDLPHVDLLSGDDVPVQEYVRGISLVIQIIEESSPQFNFLPLSALEIIFKIMSRMFYLYAEGADQNDENWTTTVFLMRSLIRDHSEDIVKRVTSLQENVRLTQTMDKEVMGLLRAIKGMSLVEASTI